MKARRKHTFIRQISISRRLMISFVLVAVVPAVLVAVFSWHKTNSFLLSWSGNYTRQIVGVLSRNLDHEIRKYEAFADELMLSEEVQTGLAGFENLSNAKKVDFIKDVSRFINRKYSLISYIREIKLLLPSGLPVYGQGYIYVSDEEMDDIYDTITRDSPLNWYSKRIGGRNYIVMTRAVNSEKNFLNIGYLVLFIDEASFFSIYSDLNLGDGSNICLVDGRGNVLSSQDRGYFLGDGNPFPVSAAEIELIRKRGVYQSYSPEFTVAGVYIPAPDWSVISFIPSAYFRNETSDILYTMLLVTIISVAVSLLVSLSTWKSISDPLAYLVRLVSESAEHRFETEIEDKSTDELGFCARSFREITRQMKLLMEQVREEQHMKREYEIKMLQAQINPHFLFNTLNSLRWTAMMSNAGSVSDGLGALSELLRSTIIDKNEFIPIKEEVKNIENYLVIQKLRYGDVFETEYDVSGEVADFPVPKLLLQPIVENSILHGLDESRPILLRITAQKKDGCIVIEISDNGKGFNPDVSFHDASPGSASASPEGSSEAAVRGKLSGIGLENVRERIALNFGSSASFSVSSAPDAGTRVVIVLPEARDV